MSITGWLLYLALAGALAGVAFALYVRREPGGRARLLAASLRAGALAVALLLVVDPWMPGLASGARDATLVLVDNSWSMRLPGGSGEAATRWENALRTARELDVARVTLLSGASVGVERLPSLRPDGAESRIAPALRGALESGARRVVLVSDGGITDLEEAARLLRAAGASVRVIDVAGAAVSNAAVSAVEAPRSGRAGDTVAVRVDVAALGMEGDNLVVALEREGEPLARARMPAPADARLASVELRLPLPALERGTRLVLVARVAPAAAASTGAAGPDALAEDDTRPFFVDVEDRPTGIVLLSLRADWEPRFLLPVLERSSGLPVRGYLRTPGGTYFTLGTGRGAARRVAEAEVRTDLESATVAVLHGVGTAAPAWVRERLSHPRLIVFPAAATEAAAFPAPLAGAIAAPVEPGDWYLEPRPPASPVAPLMAQLALQDLPPLTSLRPGAPPPGAWAPLSARRERRGGTYPVAIAGGGGARRWVVATGTGYWRWALRGGDSRRAYGLFWSSLVGWVTEELSAEGVEALRPEAAVVERGQPIVWRVPGEAGSLRVRIGDAPEVSLDTVVPVGADRGARTRSPEPGIVPWSATAGEVRASGELAVAAWSPEFVRPARDLAVLSSAGAAPGALAESRKRLHAQAWPWILLVGLLCGEWIARRRLGLR
ncbi:MAG TPA: VWA domain-containing protein [Longimicrobiales bacterium]|nr:VWA domain-containing protein [Longimicrobiales bacterium]